MQKNRVDVLDSKIGGLSAGLAAVGSPARSGVSSLSVEDGKGVAELSRGIFV